MLDPYTESRGNNNQSIHTSENPLNDHGKCWIPTQMGLDFKVEIVTIMVRAQLQTTTFFTHLLTTLYLNENTELMETFIIF